MVQTEAMGRAQINTQPGEETIKEKEWKRKMNDQPMNKINTNKQGGNR